MLLAAMLLLLLSQGTTLLADYFSFT